MPRGLDHIVHAVHDLDAAAALYRGLGFTVGARNRHSRAWGTQNHIVQFPGTFIELLAIADGSGIAPHAPRQFSFGAFNRDFLAHEQGLSMLALKGHGAPDADEFRAKGIGDFALHDFEREAKRPDGTPLKVAFTLAFAADRHAPEIGFFTCQQHYPENFWNPAFQQHANGCMRVAGIVAVDDQPARHIGFLQSFAGAPAQSDGGGFSIVTPRGAIDAVTPGVFLRRFGVRAPVVARGARLAAIRFTVAGAGLLDNVPKLGGIAGLSERNAAVIGSQDALGAVLVFEPAR
jgi:Glyoxalase-like domain